MKDLISRQAAIDALNRHLDTIPVTNNNTMEMIRRSEVMDCREIINGLPSAQPEHLVKESGNLVKGLVNDCISRQAAIDALGERPMVWAGSDYELGTRNQYDADVLAIETVPSAQPKTHDKRTEMHACDLISRQMLLEYIHGEPVGKLLCDKYNLDGLIEQFPSVQSYMDKDIQKISDIEQAQFDKIRELAYQEGKADAMAEIIRCRDCKLRDTEYCNMAHGFMGMKDDDYCSYAERREVSE